MRNLRITTYLFSIVALIALGVTGCAAPAGAAASAAAANAGVANPASTQAGLPPAQVDNSVVDMAADGTLASIYDRVNPSVVHIQVEQRASADGLPSFQFPQMPGLPNLTPQMPDMTRRAEGSGFVWDTAGHIVTNNHVVANADRITVQFADDTMVDATLVGADPDSDLAVLSIDVPAAELHPVQVADATQLRVGDLAVAIGNPFGQEGTMTVGIISALGRLLPIDTSDPAAPRYNIPDVIQTDASINPGNSGGVLLNGQGQVVGVTSAIISPAGASAGVGFAIPSTIVQQVVPALIANGRYDHPYMGISGVTLNPDLAQAADLPAEQMGALIAEVTPGSPADEANLRGSDRQVEVDGQQMLVGGDVITAVNDRPIRSMDDLVTDIYRYGKVGETITLTILRDGETQTAAVTLQARPRTGGQAAEQPETAQAQGGHGWLGTSGVTVGGEMATAMGLEPDQDGVLIQQIEQGSPADKAGLRGSFKPATIGGERVLLGGDVIVKAGDTAVHGLPDLQQFLQQTKPGDRLELTIMRDGRERQITLILGERGS